MNRSSFVPDYLLEQYILGEMPLDERQRLQSCIENDVALQARIAQIEASNNDVLKQYPVSEIVPEIRRRAKVDCNEEINNSRLRRMTLKRIQPWRSVMIPAFLAAAATLFIIVHPFPAKLKGHFDSDSSNSVRLKGIRPHLIAYRVRGNKAERLANGAWVRAKDIIQLHYISAGRKYGMVLSIDGAGSVSLHMPEQANRVEKLAASGEIALPSAFVLDAAPKFERFFLIVSDKPFSPNSVLESTRSLAAKPDARNGTLVLPASLEQFSFTLKKESL